jgi:hypothetical protein
MKRKKKPSKPIDPKSVFQLACKFAATEQHVRSTNNPRAEFMASPSMVLSAFAIELFLKCLLLLEGKEFDRIHSLNVLFRRLSHNQKRRIEEVWEKEARPKVDELRRRRACRVCPIRVAQIAKGGANARSRPGREHPAAHAQTRVGFRSSR